jgi:hypothetical protein
VYHSDERGQHPKGQTQGHDADFPGFYPEGCEQETDKSNGQKDS